MRNKQTTNTIDWWTRKGTFTGEIITIVEVNNERHLIHGEIDKDEIDATITWLLNGRQ